VPVATRFTRHYPFLLESDALSLSRGFAIQKTILCDVPLKAMHHLRKPGQEVVFALLDGSTLANLQRTAQARGITGTQLNELLGFLNMAGALYCKRSLGQKVRAWRIQAMHLMLGTRYMPLSWRREATTSAVATGVLRAVWPVIAAAFGVSLLAAASGLVPAGMSFGLSSVGVVIFTASLVVHEMLHVYVARRYSAKPQVLQIGLRLGVLHRRLPPQAEALSSIAGPLGGSLACLAGGGGALALGADLHALVAGIAALFHSLGLLPWYGDGASLHKVIRGGYKKES
jgi:hypothetical protein